MAWISLSKILIFNLALFYLIFSNEKNLNKNKLSQLWSVKLILIIITYFAFSLLWTEIEFEIALTALIKHSKLLMIVLLIYLIRTAQEAKLSIFLFASAQALIVFCSWLLFVDLNLPWVTHPKDANKATQFVVFAESYLDQSVMFATSAALLWHLSVKNPWISKLSKVLAIAAILNVLILLPGRTGYLVASAMITLAFFWKIPKKFQIVSLIMIPCIILTSAYLFSDKVREGLTRMNQESQNSLKSVDAKSSEGWRINAWHRSLQAIDEKPWAGNGVGSWTISVKRFEGENANQIFGSTNTSNPHQEYLLWCVELGLAGGLLIIALFISFLRDSVKFATPIHRMIISVVLSLSIACLFNSSLYDDLMGDYFCILLGLLMASGLRSYANSESKS